MKDREDYQEERVLALFFILCLLVILWACFMLDIDPPSRAAAVKKNTAPSVTVLGTPVSPALTVPVTAAVPPVVVTPTTVAAAAVVPVPAVSVPVSVHPAVPVSATANGTSCELRDGDVWCWGWRTAGNGVSSDVARAVGVSGAQAVFVGTGGTNCAITISKGKLDHVGSDDPGALYCWGEGINADGLTGRAWSDTPQLLAESADWDTVAIGARMLCTLTGEVVLTCYGALPDGTHSPKGTVLLQDKALADVRIQDVDGFSHIIWLTRKDGSVVRYG
jgi:hypothetical protein